MKEILSLYFFLLFLFCIPIYGTELPFELKRTFKIIYTLENLYYNEYKLYAPELQTLKNAFEVKDSIEFFVPGYEINIGVREDKPLFAAINNDGDSLVQVGTDSTYFSKLNQSNYCIDKCWRISLYEPLSIIIKPDSAVGLKGEIMGRGKKICRFTSSGGNNANLTVKGCADYVNIKPHKNAYALEINLTPSILLAGKWEVSVWPSAEVRIAGKYYSSKRKKYAIAGSILPSTPLKIYGNK